MKWEKHIFYSIILLRQYNVPYCYLYCTTFKKYVKSSEPTQVFARIESDINTSFKEMCILNNIITLKEYSYRLINRKNTELLKALSICYMMQSLI